MEDNKIMEEISEVTINTCGGVTNGSIVTKLVIGAVGVAVAVGTIIFLKKRKNRKAEIVEEAEFIPTEN